MASVTTRASLNNGMLSELTIVIPPLPEQRAIASVLSSLDDKIDLLHRQNKMLEAMAETLFR
jgi:type I restriction enzyme S subunit